MEYYGVDDGRDCRCCSQRGGATPTPGTREPKAYSQCLTRLRNWGTYTLRLLPDCEHRYFSIALVIVL
jgi:hypothetical protein